MRLKITLALLLLLSGATVFAQEESSTEKQLCEKTTESNEEINDVNNTDKGAFSLYDALTASQDTENPVIPYGLPGSTQSENNDKDDAIEGFTGLLQRVINGLTAVAASVAIFFIVFGSGGMILAAGDTEAIKKSRTAVLWALLGLLLIMGAYIIAKTAISLTYSGAVLPANQEQENCIDPQSPEGQAILSDRACNIEQPPTSCFNRVPNSDFQSRNNDVSCLIQDFYPSCGAFGIAEGSCTVEAIQTRLLNDGDYYADPSAACAQIDGKYGECTRDALAKYLQEKCDEASGAVESSS